MMNYKKILAAIIIIILIAAAAVILFFQKGERQDDRVVCILDAKLCSDGSYVSRIPPECNFTPCSKENLIQVDSPQPNEIISSPLIIKGMARGFWFFEADFPIKLLDENGELLGIAIAQAEGDWMTGEFVPFTAELIFNQPITKTGVIVFEKNNPSGLPENADELRMPILFEQKTKKVNLYYYNPEADKDNFGNLKCSRDGLVAVEREIAISKTPIQDVIRLLLSGELTEEERSRGINTEYPLEGFSLKGASLQNGILTLEFNDLNNKTVGGACRAGILWFQIEATAKQFPEVQEVRFLPEEIFQP